MDMLTSAEQRAEALFKRVRQHERKAFQGTVYVCLPTADAPEPSEDHPSTFQAWAYNISQGGIGFVAPTEIPVDHVVIGLKLPNGQVRWIHGRIVRTRPIPEEEFIDYGVAFARSDA